MTHSSTDHHSPEVLFLDMDGEDKFKVSLDPCNPLSVEKYTVFKEVFKDLKNPVQHLFWCVTSKLRLLLC